MLRLRELEASSLQRIGAAADMAVKHKRVLLLTLAGLISVLLTNWGLMAFGFSSSGYQDHTPVVLFWALPMASLPVFAVYCAWRKMPTWAFWGLLICQWVTVSWLNWDSYLHEGGTTSNPILIALSGGVAFPVWCWILIAVLCQYEHYIRAKESVTNAQPLQRAT